MTELKTLKDLFPAEEPYGHIDDWQNDVNRTLKEEAIKWVKTWRLGNSENERRIEPFWYEAWINFFNITEEELK